MRIQYHLSPLSPEEEMMFQYVLLDEMDIQCWYGIVILDLWNGREGFISIQ